MRKDRRTDKQTDRRRDMTKLIVSFHNFANAPTNQIKKDINLLAPEFGI